MMVLISVMTEVIIEVEADMQVGEILIIVGKMEVGNIQIKWKLWKTDN